MTLWNALGFSFVGLLPIVFLTIALFAFAWANNVWAFRLGVWLWERAAGLLATYAVTSIGIPMLMQEMNIAAVLLIAAITIAGTILLPVPQSRKFLR